MTATTSPRRICTVIGRTRHKMIAVELQEAVKRGADLIELRLDFIGQAPDFKRLLANKACEMIATVRRVADGGRWTGDETARQMLLRQCVVGGFDWVDLETDVADKIPRFGKVKRIVSFHDMNGVPPDLDEIYDRMTYQDADVLKIAVMAQSVADNAKVLAIQKRAKRPTVAFCMGELGFPSRLIAAKFGAPFTYAAFNKERGIAPGMPSFDEVKRVYRPERITPATRFFGVVGDPIAHSLSPLVHNAAFRALSLDAIYLPIRVPTGDLAECLKAYAEVPFDGYSVTIPHKESAAKLAATREPLVEQTQSANTLVRRANGFAAYNTDYPAFLESLTARLPHNPGGAPPDLTRKGAIVLGAGGMARSAAHALSRAGCHVFIANRDHGRGAALAAEVGGEAIDWKARHKEGCEIVVNCTPVGMHPNVDDSPIHISFLKPGLIVFDTVYTPETTLLVKESRARECHVITGVDLFVRQAGQQFRLFTDHEPPWELMASVLKRALSPLTIAAPEGDSP